MGDFIKKYGPWAVVTGASSGIGEEFCRQLAALKMNLALVARREENLKKLAADLGGKHNIKIKIISVDVSQSDFMKQITAVTDTLEVGLLVNNAGFALTGDFFGHTLDEELSLLNVNCRAPIVLSHIFGNKMAKRGKGGIINVSSVAAYMPMSFWSNYAASKAYLLSFSDGLSFELKGKGVDVLALCPGGTRTEFSKVAGIKSGGVEPVGVVELALKSLGKKSSVIPGLGNNLIPVLNRLLPRQWLTNLGAKVVALMVEPKA